MDSLTSLWPRTVRRTPSPHTAHTERHLGTRWSRSSGQALVEFALIAPLFLLLLFAVVEYALINASVGTFNFAAKDAARLGAILGESLTQAGVPTDTYIVNDVILPRVQGVVMAKGTEIEIYNSDETGACVTSGGVCQEDIWTPSSSGVWTSNGNAATGSGWPYSQRNDSLANADYLGVKISYTYTYMTAFFATTSPTISLTALSVQRIEPQQYGDRHEPGRNAWVATTPGANQAWAPFPIAFAFAPFDSGYWEPQALRRLAGERI